MSDMLILDKEYLRISPKNTGQLEYSTDGGRRWLTRYSGVSSTGEFRDLKDAGRELLAVTSKGLFYSKDNGRRWLFRSR